MSTTRTSTYRIVSSLFLGLGGLLLIVLPASHTASADPGDTHWGSTYVSVHVVADAAPDATDPGDDTHW